MPEGPAVPGTLLERARRGEPLGIEAIDIHGHVGRASFAIPDLSAAGLVAAMDRMGVRTAVCSHIRCLSADVEHGNGELAKMTAAHPGRILGYVAIYPSDAAEVREQAERWLAAPGFVGVKLHNCVGFPYTDAAYEPALRIAGERRMPVLLHTWGDSEMFEQVRRLAGLYPGAAFLLAHSGSQDEAGYVAVAREFANVFLELSWSLAPRGLVARLVEGAGVEKVLWGSDGYFMDPAQQIGRVAGADISEAAKIALLSTNARRLLDRVQR